MAAPQLNHRVEYGGRRIGKPQGSHVSGDLVELKKSIVLCRSCRHRFDHKRHRYYRDRRFAFVQGNCDACREFESQASFYIHESYLTDSRGRTPLSGGSSWIPK